MKAVIETIEPVIRPTTNAVRTVPAVRRAPVGFVAVRVESPLFHAWRA